MSSFKRKGAAQRTPTLPGTRPSPGSTATIITSTGVPSLDDILGGGLPLSCSLVVAAPDSHSSYGELVQKYFVAQGLVSCQDVVILSDEPIEFVKGCMWTVNKSTSTKGSSGEGGDAEERSEEKIKIAWRYENMKQFQTTVGHSIPNAEDFCAAFELSSRIPDANLQRYLTSGRLSLCDVNSLQSPANEAINKVQQTLLSRDNSTPIRICIPAFGSPSWGELSPEAILDFLRQIRTLLCQHTHACASISLPSHLSSENWGGRGWMQKVGWLTDALITFAAFTANPSMTTLFPSHHGLVHIHSLPAPLTLLPPSDKFSTLRGLSAAAADSSGSGENNLAFKCTRKRLVIETLHLDVEGGVSERRTTPSSNTSELPGSSLLRQPVEAPHVQEAGLATLHVELETKEASAVDKADGSLVDAALSTDVQGTKEGEIPSQSKVKKPKKKVGFRSDRPDVYDF